MELTAREFDLLELLMKNPNRVYSREQLLNLVWGYEYTGEYRTVDVHIRRLREKVEQDPAHPAHLCTKWGWGTILRRRDGTARKKKGAPWGESGTSATPCKCVLPWGYSCLIAVLLVLMNTYPLIMGQNLMFRSQQTALANQLVLITNTLTTADELTPETVEQAIGQLEELEVRRVLVTDGAGRVLYDTGEPSALGKYAPHWRGGLRPPGQRRLFQ